MYNFHFLHTWSYKFPLDIFLYASHYFLKWATMTRSNIAEISIRFECIIKNL